MLWIPLGLWLAGAGGCSCQPQLPMGDDDDDGPDPTDTFSPTPTGDTGPEPPCAAPEVEPNNEPGLANLLPMEQRGCGAIDPQFDADYWNFTLEDAGWLTIEVEKANGSQADMNFILRPLELFDGVDDGWSAGRSDGREDPDAVLTFLAPAGLYELLVTEQNFDGGPDRYGYDVLVTESKPPVDPWTRTEVEPNDNAELAEPVNAGDILYGTMNGNGALNDSDWYEIVIPPGRHAMHIDVVAFNAGSSADLSVYLWDFNVEPLPPGCRTVCPASQPGCVRCEIRGGGPGDFDPVGTYDSLGAETVYIQVTASQNCRGTGQPCPDGPANWYTLRIDLEET